MSESGGSAARGARAAMEGVLGVEDEVVRSFALVGIGIAVVAVTMLVVFAINGLWFGGAARRYLASARDVRHSHQAMLDMETALRGYLATGDQAFLGPYQRGRRAIVTLDDRLTRRLAGDGHLGRLLLDTRLSQQAWIDGWAVPARAQPVASRSRPALVAFLARGRTLFDGYRRDEAALESEVDGLRTRALDRQQQVLVGGAVLVVLTGAAMMVVALVQYRRLRRAVVLPANELLATIDRLGTGDLAARAEVDRPREFALIGRGLADMAEAVATQQADLEDNAAVVEAQAGQLHEILDMARNIAGSLSLRYVLRAVADSAATVSGFPRVVIWLLDERGHQLVASYDRAAAGDQPLRLPSVDLGSGIVGQSARYGRVFVEGAGATASEVVVDAPLAGLAVPLVVGARVVGVLEFRGEQAHGVSQSALEVLETLATHAAASIEAARLHAKAEELGATDALTGLANRRVLDGDLDLEVARAVRYARPLALLMLDVDHFKQFNDRYGHQRGDEILQELARVLEEEVRATDTAYRYGGEEFTVLARDTSAPQGQALAERIRLHLAGHFPDAGAGGDVTVSIGVAELPAHDPTPAGLVGAADAALYRAKAAGRNRTVVSE